MHMIFKRKAKTDEDMTLHPARGSTFHHNINYLEPHPKYLAAPRTVTLFSEIDM